MCRRVNSYSVLNLFVQCFVFSEVRAVDLGEEQGPTNFPVILFVVATDLSLLIVPNFRDA